jgi:hypothetical protein
MDRKVLFLTLVVTLMGFSVIIPSTNYDNSLTQSLLNPYSKESTPSGIGDNFENFIDTLSDLHSPSDIGTHNVFSDLQNFGSNYDQMTEADTGSAGYNLEDYVDQQSNLHAPSDVGTHSDFAEMQDTDAAYDTLTEGDTGSAGSPESWMTPTSFQNPSSTWSSETLAYDDNTGTGASCAAPNGAGYFGYLELYLSSGVTSTKIRYWIAIGTKCDGFQVDVYDGAIWTNVLTTATPTTGAWTNVTFTQQNVDAVRFRFSKSNGADSGYYLYEADILQNAVPSSTNYDLDLEVGWTTADFVETNEFLCIYGGTQGTEELRVDVWDGSQWQNVVTDVAAGWNNVTVSSYLTSSSFEIRFTDTSNDSTAQDTWQIDGVLLHVWTVGFTNYELDLEVGWTTADYDEQNEELCIYAVTGGGWPSEDIKVDVWNGVWTNIIADLTPDQWNNVSVSSYLTSSSLEIRFLGGTETGDTTQSKWEIDAVLLHSWTVSYAPANDQGPTLDNPTDTDKMYAQYQEYQVTVYVSDQNGFADIAYLEIGFWNDSQTTEYCRFRYDEDTNSFTKVFDGGTYVSLNTGSSSAVESGNDINATFFFTVDWDFPDSVDLDARCYVVDAQTESATTWYEVNWDVETRLDYSGSLSIYDGSGTPNRGDLGGSFSFTGTVIYYNSVDDYPLSSAVDVWVSAAGIGDWNDTTLTSGAFDVTCFAASSVSTSPGDTYTVKVVEEGAGSTGTDLFYTASATETYIADQLVITITDPSNQRINIHTNASGIVASAVYDYDGTTFDGLLTLNNTDFNYTDARIEWYTVQSASGGVHGVSLIGVNDATCCIWDSLTITITGPASQRINIHTNASGIVASAIYDYDGTAFDGLLTLNNTDFNYTDARIEWYTVQSVSGDSYGITAIRQNDVTYCIWDSLTITITGPASQRINIHTNASGIVVSAIYDYDGAAFDGTLTLNNTNFNYTDARIEWYTVQSVSGDSYGITAIRQNDVTYCIWDSLTITITDPSVQRINIHTNASGIVISAVYDYDGIAFDGIFALNNTNFNYTDARIEWYTVQSVSADSYGITAIRQNDVTYCIWDSLTITITGPANQRISIHTNASGIVVTAIYDYDGTSFDGLLTLNNTNFNYTDARIEWYSVQSASGGAYGITAIRQNDVTYCIWDSLTITITGPASQRINIHTNASGIVLSAIYDYDGTTFDGVFTLNNTNFNYTDARIEWYTVQSVSGDSYGITAIRQNDVTYCIWDSLTIAITGPANQRINIHTNASGIIVSAVYDYDGAAFDGVFTLNNTNFNYTDARIEWYTVQSVSGDSYGITAIRQNDVTYCIWDSLTITITDPSVQRINIHTNASGIVVTAIYDYDGTAFDGVFTLNNTNFNYSGARIEWYTVQSASGGAYGITAIRQNDVTYCIWDQLVVTIGVDELTPLNNIQANFSLTVSFDYDNLACLTYQLVIQRNGTWWRSFTNANKSLFVDTNFDSAYTYTVRMITSESDYNILAFFTNSVQVVWSAAPNNAPVNDAAPVLVNPDDSTYMYARYRYYVITSNVSDMDGYDDIVYVELTLYDDSRASAIWTVRYTVVGGTFSIQLGSAYITLSASSSASMSGNDLDITWYIKIDWNHSILTNTDVKQYVYDGTDGVEDFYESNWDIETRFEIIGLTIDDGAGTGNRGPLDGSYFATGTIVYLGSVDNYPLSNETDVWLSVSEYGINTGPWSDFVLVSGQFNITAYADDQVGLDTITIKIVLEGAGSGGTDLLSVTTQSTYITDRILVQGYSAADDRINIGDTAIIDVELVYQYDSSFVIDGTVTVNGLSATHQGFGVWRFTDSQPLVVMNTYDSVVYNGGTHGLTQVNQNATIQEVIWDQIVVQTTIADDTHVNIGDTVEIQVTLWLAYDSSPLGSGDTVILNGTAMTWDVGNNRFELPVSLTSLGQRVFFVNSSTESTYAITVVDTNSQSIAVTWDRIQVQSYSSTDTRVNIGDNVNIDVALQYEFDNAPVNSGNVTLNGVSAVFQGAGVWRISDSKSSVGMSTYDLVACLNNTHNVTLVSQNGQSISIVWDQLVILISVDNASPHNNQQANFTLTATFDYDSLVCSTYQLVINRNAVWWHSFAAANLSYFVDVRSDATYNYTTRMISSESTYGITAFTTNTLIVTWSISPNEVPTNDGAPNLTNADDVDCLYARYRFYVIITSVSDPDGYANISYVELSLYSNDQSTLYWTVRYTLGTNTFSVEVGGSNITIGSMSAATGAGNTLTITWYLKIGWNHENIIDSDAEQFVTDGLASDSDFYETNWNVETRLDYSVAPALSDDRGDVNTADLIGTGSVTYYGSSLSPLANETDVWVIHDVSGAWIGDVSAGSFSISGISSSASVRLNTYTFKTVAEGAGSGGTDLYFSTSPTGTFITDRIEIYEAGVVDSRIDINSNCEIWWRARYGYDGAMIQSALVFTLNGTQVLSWSPGDSYWMLQESQSAPQSAGYAVASASETTYGITSWTISTSAQQVVWDRVRLVSLTATSLSLDIGDATEIHATFVYEYDNTPVTDGSVFLDDNGASAAMSYDSSEGYWKTSITKSSAGSYTFTIASISANMHGITSLNLNGHSVAVEWVGAPPIIPDTMTLMLVGGGIGLALLGVAIIAMKRRGTSAAAGLVDTGSADLETPMIVEEIEAGEPVTEEPEVSLLAETIEPEKALPAEAEIEPAPADTEAAGEMIEAEEVSTIEAEAAVAEEPPDTLPETELEPLEDVEAAPEEAVSQIGVKMEPEAPKEIAEPSMPIEDLSDESLTKEDILDRLPPEVRAAIPEEDLTKMTRKEAQSLVESYSPRETPLPVPEPSAVPTTMGVEELSKLDKKVLIELLPQDIKDTISPGELRRLTKKELISLLESFMEPEG